MANIIIELTDAQQIAIEKLTGVQKKNERTSEQLTADLMASIIKGRAVAASKAAKENAGKLYDLAVAAGFAAPGSKGEFMNKKVIEWQRVVDDLGTVDDSEASA